MFGATGPNADRLSEGAVCGACQYMTGYFAQRWQGHRFACAIAALLVTAIIGYTLIMGLRAAPILRVLADNSPLVLFDLKPPLPDKPKPERPSKQRVSSREGGSRPAPARPHPVKAETPPPAQTVAPPPVIELSRPVAPATAPSEGTGIGTAQGHGGSGAGGQGVGSGSGNGEGMGRAEGGGGAFSRARQTDGRFRNSDFPPSARGAGRLKIGVRYAIGPSGRVDKCEIIETSGYAEVDAMTCRIIMERYRFRPARDPDGYPVTEVREEDYRWRVH